VYDKGVIPAEREGVKLPTCADLKKQEKILPPEKR